MRIFLNTSTELGYCHLLYCIFYVLCTYFFYSPISPQHCDWSELYPKFCKPLIPGDVHDDSREEDCSPQVEFADIGCGYGGLLGKYVYHIPVLCLSHQYSSYSTGSSVGV